MISPPIIFFMLQLLYNTFILIIKQFRILNIYDNNEETNEASYERIFSLVAHLPLSPFI